MENLSLSSQAINVIMQTKTTKEAKLASKQSICINMCKYSQHVNLFCAHFLMHSRVRRLLVLVCGLLCCFLFTFLWLKKRGNCNYSSSASSFLVSDRREIEGMDRWMARKINWKKRFSALLCLQLIAVRKWIFWWEWIVDCGKDSGDGCSDNQPRFIRQNADDLLWVPLRGAMNKCVPISHSYR